jgi:ABC-type antimicrobial peptide transport system permease subunit
MLIGFFGITALLLASVGLFGLIAYSVNRRTREFGVRIALGATPRDVLRMVLGQGMRTILIGVVIGIVGSFALTQTLTSLLFGVTATDPVTFGGVTIVLIAVALLACYIPARRATKAGRDLAMPEKEGTVSIQESLLSDRNRAAR